MTITRDTEDPTIDPIIDLDTLDRDNHDEPDQQIATTIARIANKIAQGGIPYD